MRSLFIFRRDFRIYDNTTLNYLMKENYEIVPIFIFNEKQIEKNEYKSNYAVNFMIESLLHLNKEVNESLNFFYTKNEIDLLEKLCFKHSICCIAFNKDNTYYSMERDKNIGKMCIKNNIKIISFEDYTIFPINSIKTLGGKYYEVYKPFYLNVINKMKDIKPEIKKTSNKFMKISNDVNPLKFYTRGIKGITNGGRPIGRKLLMKLKKFKNYENTRNLLEYNTSLIGAHLKFGTISIREFAKRILDLYGVNHGLMNQIIWREFYVNLFINLGYKKTIGGSNYKNLKIKWENDEELFEKWCNGKTGFPLVDAGMRQLNSIGWMHNRTRMIVANFLSFILHIDWHKGEKYFATKLIDYDVAINNGNWQWSVGLGVDRSQFLRIFNPQSQINEYDKNCVYIKKWIPELRNVDATIIKKWQDIKDYTQWKYQKPCVNYSERRIKSVKDLYNS